MIGAIMAIMGPAVAAVMILVLRRWTAAWSLAGAAAGVAGAGYAVASWQSTARFAIPLGIPDFPFLIEANRLSVMLSLIVAIVALCISVYAAGYMRDDGSKTRFYAAFSGFIAAMQLFVLAGDWLLLLASWELMALASYLLIAHQRSQPAAAAATRAFLTTRTADIGFYIAAVTLIMATGTSRISATFDVSTAIAALAAVGVVISASAKAAQAPFDGWLRDAMAGPTPVSALLHSATMVAAGALLLIRLQPLFAPGMLLAIALIGGITAVLSGMTAVAQTDLKRMLAASTSSQIGFMLLALGAGSVGAAIAHFAAHAAMKATLFMGSGVFQHAAEDTAYSSLRGYGRQHKLTYAIFAAAGIALAGIPPLAGFWSKESVIAAAFTSSYAGILVPLVLAGTILTGWYIARALRLLWSGDAPAKPVAGQSWMLTGMTLLTLAVLGFGLIMEPMLRFIGVETSGETRSLISGLLTSATGLAVGWLVSGYRLAPLHDAALNGWYLSRLVDALTKGTARMGTVLVHAIDFVVESIMYMAGAVGLGVAWLAQNMSERLFERIMTGTAGFMRSGGHGLRRLQTGLVHQEMIATLSGTVILIIIVIIAVRT